MNCEFRTNGVDLEHSQIEHTERRLAFALSRFSSRILKTIVYLADDNGPKGGVDKSCHVLVRLRGGREVIAKVVDTDWKVAIDRAISRIGHSIRRQLQRAREYSRDSVAAAKIMDPS